MGLFLSGQPDLRDVNTLLSCRQQENLLKLFRQKLEETKSSLVAADDMVRIHRLQGRAEILEDFLQAVLESPAILERLQNQPRVRSTP
jgi:hypothetical protein